jgi:hypothetical protein
MKTHIRRTALTIEFEQVYRSSQNRAFLSCEECGRQNTLLVLSDAIWLLRGVLQQLESRAPTTDVPSVCLFCLCAEMLGSNTDHVTAQVSHPTLEEKNP